MKRTTKVFISQPMRNRSEEDIITERQEIMRTLKYVLGGANDLEELPTYFTDHGARTPLEGLAKSIEMLAQADIAIFAIGWSMARDCIIERECCAYYDIEYAYYGDILAEAVQDGHDPTRRPESEQGKD